MTANAFVIHAPAAEVFDYASLSEDVAGLLQERGASIREMVGKATEAIIEIGRDLLAVKEHLDRGRFCEWIEAECRFSLSSAENYMRAASFSEGKIATVTKFTPATVYQLSARSAPPKVVAEVLAQAERGEVASTTAIKVMLSEARFQQRAQQKKEQPNSHRTASAKRRRARLEEAARQKQEDERAEVEAEAKARAARIIDGLGADRARILFEALSGPNAFEVLRQLRLMLASARGAP